jgi:GMP reductase
MRIEPEVKLDFSSVLIRPKISTLGSRSEVVVARRFKFKWSEQLFEGVPIISANMDTVSTFEMANALRKFGCSAALHKHYTVNELISFFTADQPHAFYSMGILPADLEKFELVELELAKRLYDAKAGMDEIVTPIRNVCIDVANGYSTKFLEFVKRFREKYPKITIMAGNVVTADVTEQLILAGVDIVKVGIGPGSACTTRKMTGIGYPQLSAVIECADAAHGLGGLICADGGCTEPGDIAKAFGGGADFVMLGGMLAGHNEGGGSFVTASGRPFTPTLASLMEQHEKVFVEFYGMSSKAAQEKHNGGVAEYRASEGKRVMVPYKGAVEGTIKEILGGLRSACTYVGAKTLKDLSKCTTFIMVDNQRNHVFDKYEA